MRLKWLRILAKRQSRVYKMLVQMGCKKWTRGTQLGLRIYTDTIRKFESILNSPSNDNKWETLVDFMKALKQGNKVRPYSRNILLVARGKVGIECTMTIAKHGRTTQGYITAPHNTWFYKYVQSNIDENFEYEYVQSHKIDLLVIPKHGSRIQKEIEKDAKEISKKVNQYCKVNKVYIPPNLKEIGLFYEIKEREFLESQGFIVRHRYPYLESSHPDLIVKQVSCDMDVFDDVGNFVKFVEVKSLTATPGTEFNISRNEFESRKKCQTKNWSYEIVVYYHFGNNIIKRHVINLNDKMIVYPSSYWCKS